MGLGPFPGLLCASLSAKALNRDRNGQPMAGTEHRSQLAGGLWEQPALLAIQPHPAGGAGLSKAATE